MKKSLFFMFLFWASINSYAIDFTQGYQNYKKGMEAYGRNDFKKAELLLSRVITSSEITDEQKIYSLIALSNIYQSNGGVTKAVSVLGPAWKQYNSSPGEGERDLGLVLARLYRDRNISEFNNSFKVSARLLHQFPNDESVMFNFAVANLFMAGRAAELNESKNKVNAYFARASKYSNLVSKSKNKEFSGAAYNLMGLVEDRQGNYSSAVTNFNKAIILNSKPIYHRNLGWALYAGLSRKLKGKAKLDVIRRAYYEFKTAIAEGDHDPTTEKQLPGMESLLKIHPGK